MAEEMTILMDKERINIDWFRHTDPLPQVVMNLNSCTPFVFLLDGNLAAQCLTRTDATYQGLYDIVNYAADSAEHLRGALSYLLNYYRQNGGRYMEIGCGNAQLDLYALLQQLGFRAIGVLPDYYLSDNKTATIENAIINRDMLRFRADLHEKKLSTTGYDASGRTPY